MATAVVVVLLHGFWDIPPFQVDEIPDASGQSSDSDGVRIALCDASVLLDILQDFPTLHLSLHLRYSSLL